MKTIEEAAKETYKTNSKSKSESKSLWLTGNEISFLEQLAFNEGAKFAQRWIPVEEELPNECTFVLTKYKNTYSVSWYDGEFNEMYNPTHWRPIELK